MNSVRINGGNGKGTRSQLSTKQPVEKLVATDVKVSGNVVEYPRQGSNLHRVMARDSDVMLAGFSSRQTKITAGLTRCNQVF